ncbi:MAG: hypothetical protein U0703_23180 [Anaerolineae bacterium]
MGRLPRWLRASYEQALALVQSFETWDGEDDIGGALAMLVHSAYHLGEIWQALCTLRQAAGAVKLPQTNEIFGCIPKYQNPVIRA